MLAKNNMLKQERYTRYCLIEVRTDVAMVIQPAPKTYTGYALSVLIQFNGDKFGVLAR